MAMCGGAGWTLGTLGLPLVLGLPLGVGIGLLYAYARSMPKIDLDLDAGVRLLRRAGPGRPADRQAGPAPEHGASSMSDRDRVINERAAESWSDFMEHGPRLSLDRQSYVLARGEGERVLLGGLGCMGTGTMWSILRPHIENDPTYADAPYDPTRKDDFGDDGQEVGTQLEKLVARGDRWLGLVKTPAGLKWEMQAPRVVGSDEWKALPYEPERLDQDGWRA